MNSFIWRKKNITGGSADTSNLVTLNSAQTISGAKTFSAATTMNVLHMNNTVIDQLANPTQPQNAATKSYVDNAKYGNWVLIASLNNLAQLTDSFVEKWQYTNFANTFTMEANATYEILVKCNPDGNKDAYANCCIGVNNVNYDNYACTNSMYWGNDAIVYRVYLKNNQIKVEARRIGSQTSWNTNTRIYIRKIMSGGL